MMYFSRWSTERKFGREFFSSGLATFIRPMQVCTPSTIYRYRMGHAEVYSGTPQGRGEDPWGPREGRVQGRGWVVLFDRGLFSDGGPGFSRSKHISKGPRADNQEMGVEEWQVFPATTQVSTPLPFM